MQSKLATVEAAGHRSEVAVIPLGGSASACPRRSQPERRPALLAVISHCTVHNTLMRAPDIAIILDDTADPAPTEGAPP